MVVASTAELSLMKLSVHIDETHLEGRMSYYVDIRLVFCFMACRKLMFVKSHDKSQKLPIFCQKIKSRPHLKNMRHPSLQKNVSYDMHAYV